MPKLILFDSSHPAFIPIMKIVMKLLIVRNSTLVKLGFIIGDENRWYVSDEQLSYLMLKYVDLL